MSRIIYPINNKEYTAEDVEIANCTRTSGVHSVLDFDCSLNGNVLTVGKGLGWIKNSDFSGKTVAFTEPETFTLEDADSALDRYDVVAIRYDATKKEPEIVIIKGEAKENPTMPTRNTESYLYELFLYAILRKAGESTASFENVTDLRENKNYCGIMEDSVTSAVAPVYETIFEETAGVNFLKVGDTVDFNADEFEYLIATLHSGIADVSLVLTKSIDSTHKTIFAGSSDFYVDGGGGIRYFARIDVVYGSNTGHKVVLATYSNQQAILPSDANKGLAQITKIIGVTKQPKGYVAVDDVYNPESHNAQSGEAVRQAIEEALAEFEPPEQDTGSGVSEAQRQTLLAVVNAIGLFNVPNAQTLLDNFNKAWDIVEPVPATSITLDKAEITFTSEETQTIVATVLPANTTDVVVWTSSNTSIATVKNGVVTPLVDGETIITAKAGNVSATCKVTVSLYGDIENPVYLLNGFLGKESTSTSEPVKNDAYANALSLTAIPVKNGSVFAATMTQSNLDNQNFNRWRFYDESGAYSKDLYSSGDYTTVTAKANGFIRFEMLYTSNKVTGDELPVTKVTVTTNGESVEYTVVDKR